MSNARRSQYVGKRAIAALLSATMVTTGVAVINTATAPAAFAADKKSWKGVTTGPETVSVAKYAKAGGQLMISAANLKAGETYTLKLDDGNLQFEDNQKNANVKFAGGFLEIVAGQEGTISEEITLPASLSTEEHNIRLLGSGASKFDTFEVVAADAEIPTADAAALELKEVKVWAGRTLNREETFVSFSTKAFGEGAVVKADIDGKEAVFNGRSGGATKTVSGDVFDDAVKIDGSVLVGKKHTLTLTDTKDESKKTSVEFELPAPYLALADQQNADLPNSSIGSTVDVALRNIPEGAEVTFVGADGTNFLPAGKLVGGSDNTVAVKGVNIPNNEALVGKTIEVKVKIDGKEQTFSTPLTVTISNAAMGVENYNIQQADLQSGLYQVVKSDKANALFVTRAQRSAESQLLKVDPETLKVIASVNLGHIDGIDDKDVNSVFGVAVDDKLGYVWATNTRSGAVTVFNQDDLSIKKTFPAQTLGHPRDVIVDPQTSKAYVTDVSATKGAVQVFDGKTLKAEGGLKGQPEINGAVGAAFDPESGDLFTVPFDAPFKLVRVNVRNGESQTWDLPNGNRTTGVSYDSKTKEVFITNQYSSSLTVFDTKKGEVKDTITVGAGTVYAAYDKVSDRVYVTNRVSGTLTVIDPNTHKVVANIPVGHNPNDVRVDGKGGVYLVNKSSQVTEKDVDQIFHITPKKSEVPNPGTPSTPGSSGSSDFSTSKLIPLLGALFGFGLLAAVIGGIMHFIKNNPMPALPPMPPLPDFFRM